MADSYSQKSICKKVFEQMLGPAAAQHIDGLNELDCVQQCQERLRSFFDEAMVRRFDQLYRAMASEVAGLAVQQSDKKGQKERCREIMLELFGPASAARVDEMPEGDCIVLCRAKVKALLGEKYAKKFDQL